MKKRFYAFLTHLTASIMVGMISAAVVFLIWYPAPLDVATGVRQIFLLMLMIDVILGPLVTFLTYKPIPSFLKFDLPIIVICQMVMLGFGVYSVFKARPAFIVYSNAHFTVVRLVDLQPDSLIKAQQQHNASAIAGWMQPKWVATPVTSDPTSDFVISANFFQPIEKVKSDIVAQANPLAELKALYKNRPEEAKLNEWRETEVKWMPLSATAKNMVVLVDSHSAAVLKILDMNPAP